MLSFIWVLFSSYRHSTSVSSNARREPVGIDLDAFSLLCEFLKVHLFEYSSSPASLVWFFASTMNFHFILWLGFLALILMLGLLPLGHPVPPTIQTLPPLLRSTCLPGPVFVLRTPVLAGSCLPDFHQLPVWFGGGMQCRRMPGQWSDERPLLSPFLLESSVPPWAAGPS